MKKTIPICLLFLAFISCNDEGRDGFPFDILAPNASNIHFANNLADSDSFNIMQYLYFYNGGGVAAGDLNNDGWIDLFFTGNQVKDALYFNNGELKFTDVSKRSGINEYNGWSTGVTFADINQDGWLDIYVCRLGKYKIYDDHNRLYINNQDGTFTELAEEYGLDFSGFGTQAAFFDYDKDGDLDCYLLNHSVKRPDQFVQANKIRYEVDSLAGDRLFRNEDSRFVDVTSSSGIYSSSVGFGLSVCIADLNDDFWPDIYVGNDFHENDYLYLNNRDGTFREVIRNATGHTSNFTMGSTVMDINNDQMWDIFSLDMQPWDEVIYKQSGGWESKQIYDFKRSYKYHDQSPRNALQVRVNQVEETPMYSEQASIYGLHASDWSWSPLVADFDLDGDQDIYITNGIYHRPNDMDFVNYFSNPQNGNRSDKELISKMPKGLISNQFYIQENGQFTELSAQNPSISNGGCMADLDNDGDLDIVANNLNESASLLINRTNPKNYLRVTFSGKQAQTAIKNGVVVQILNDELQLLQTVSFAGNKGFQSMDQPIVILPKSPEDHVLLLHWTNGITDEYPIEKNTKEIDITDDNIKNGEIRASVNSKTSLDSIDIHQENEYNDQNKEPLLLYSFSQNGPKITQSRDGHVFVTQGKGHNGSIIDPIAKERIAEIEKGNNAGFVDETDALFFDADGDGDDDLYVCLGGNELPDGDLSLPDVLFINEHGTYVLSTKILPKIPKNTSTVTASDYDNDGDLDLFVGVQSRASDYGNPDASYLLKNNKNETFEAFLLDLKEMVFDSEWADLDNDGRPDLVVSGHWMPVTIFYNRLEGFQKVELPNSEGWWYSLQIGDFDKDGLPDIMAGNFGENHRLQVSETSPLKMYLNDFDQNGKNDPIITYQVDGKEYPYANLDLLLKQLPGKKKQFILHSEYAQKTISELFTPDELEESKIRIVKTLSSTVFFQEEYNEWKSKSLPKELQLAPIWTIASHGDKYIVGGNHFDIDPNLGRQDALPLSMFEFDGQEINVINHHYLPKRITEVRSLLSFQDKTLLIGINDGPVLLWD
ncbi:MAG: VCBS repeat-containing protein [Bacteroidota bacterium]